MTGTIDRNEGGCRHGCVFSNLLLGRGDHVGFDTTAPHKAAAAARATRASRERKPFTRLIESLERVLERQDRRA